jgi:hypothetical protein
LETVKFVSVVVVGFCVFATIFDPHTNKQKTIFVKDRLTITHAQVGSIKFEFLGRPEINVVNIVKKGKNE